MTNYHTGPHLSSLPKITVTHPNAAKKVGTGFTANKSP